MDHSNGTIWKRSALGPDFDDIWDDRALIDAYDKAVKEVNRRIADKSNDSNIKSTGVGTTSCDNQCWHLGQYCRSVYSEDGIEYEAQIISIDVQNNSCFVKYLGYGNEEQKSLKELKSSFGKSHRKLQTQQVLGQSELVNSGSDNDNESHSNGSTFNNRYNERIQTEPKADSYHNIVIPTTSHTKPLVPPPLPSALEATLPADDEALASMLMSWYMSGYHTGYYRALKQCKHLCNK